MKTIRERFEEIWPVPDVIFWGQDIGRYAPMPDEVLQYERLNEQWAHEHNARLDTFTRCQETTDLYLTLIDDLAYDLGRAYNHLKRGTTYNTHSLDRAKQLLEQKK